MVLEQLEAALSRLGIAPEGVCFVSDIGCVGLADRYLASHTFHGLHGRSITYAEGIKRACPDLTVIVLIGDGGCGIGTAHLIHAARRGADIKVIVCNNFNFGMTGGQHSATTPPCASTVTTRGGATETPFDICRTVMGAGAHHVARFTAFDDDAVKHFTQAIETPGFSLVDVWELCVAYYVPANKLSPPKLKALSERLDMPFGVLRHDPAESLPLAVGVEEVAEDRPDALGRSLPWPGRTALRVAGSAGQRIRSSVGVIGEIAVAGGLHAAQEDDFPITVRRGHSISNLIVAEGPIHYTSVDNPDLLIVLSNDGAARLGALDHLRSECLVLVAEGVDLSPTQARVRRFDFRRLEKEVGKNSAALAVLASALPELGWIDADALNAAARATLRGNYRDANLSAIESGIHLYRSTAAASG